MNINNQDGIKEGIDLDEYYCKSRLRIDRWNFLKNEVVKLVECHDKGKDITELRSKVKVELHHIKSLEIYWAFPGVNIVEKLLIAYNAGNWNNLARLITSIARLISTDHYRSHDWMTAWQEALISNNDETNIEKLNKQGLNKEGRPYFEVLVVDCLAVETRDRLIDHHMEHRRPEDKFVYNITVVSTFEDAIIAIILNYNIQSCVIRYTFPYESTNKMKAVGHYIEKSGYRTEEVLDKSGHERAETLSYVLKHIRPEIDLYLLSEATVEHVTRSLHRNFRRCFFGSEDYPETRLTILKGIQQRYETPFFNALKDYAQQPTGVYHAMPISRSKSISKSHWIRDYGEFYGDRMFLSETSSTIGGLDSLLQPSGSIRKAQELAAESFGSNQSFYVSNGTSTANKIVIQAITRPGDIVLIAGDSHKSHYYGAILSGICPIILRPYSIDKYTISGAVSIKTIKRELLDLDKKQELNKVRALILTNLTFDGIAYNLFELMKECLAIKPDLIFFIDEAWFGYGIFSPITRQRSAMYVARALKEYFKSRKYQATYSNWKKMNKPISQMTIEEASKIELLPDPDLIKIRVYSTQSTHKTLTALRQASMIHIKDDEYIRDIAFSMREAYLCHTSTSPNYQIIASLDIARRQMHFEGYELLQKAYELAIIVRNNIRDNRLLSKYFKVLESEDLIPSEFRSQEFGENLLSLEESWSNDELALDPSRITLDITQTGMSGNEFQNLLMNKFDIQVNKTSFNTILIIIHIGSTRGMITYLIESLSEIARDLDNFVKTRSNQLLRNHFQEICEQEENPTQIPPFTDFYPLLGTHVSSGSKAGDLRKAYTLSRQKGAIEYMLPTEEIAKAIDSGLTVISATIVTPYPPGYPILLPGQIVSAKIIRYLILLGNQEIHGFDKQLGLEVFSKNAINSLCAKK